MAYKKFDDPAASGDASARKLYGSFPNDALRRAIQSITNRIISGTGGTMGGTAGLANDWIGTGGTSGIVFNNRLILSINGRLGTAASHDNINLPKGTQGSGTWVKYLVAAKFGGTACTIVAGNEGASSTAARLPDCPDGMVAIGYMEYNTTSGKFIRFGGGTANSYNVLSGNVAATCGTLCGTCCLLHMPYDEA